MRDGPFTDISLLILKGQVNIITCTWKGLVNKYMNKERGLKSAHWFFLQFFVESYAPKDSCIVRKGYNFTCKITFSRTRLIRRSRTNLLILWYIYLHIENDTKVLCLFINSPTDWLSPEWLFIIQCNLCDHMYRQYTWD